MKNQNFLLTSPPTNEEAQVFMPNLVPVDKLIHKGILSPDNQYYFFTLSEKDFTNFEVKQVTQKDGKWSEPKNAFFNSKYDEHGMSFSPDGKQLYFSSTRPSKIDGIPNTWHLWVSEKVNGEWSKPRFVDIPNMKDKLLSHPSITNSGKMYFHASNLDYSAMNIYCSTKQNGKFTDAVLVNFNETTNPPKCTPIVSLDERYLIFAEIQEDLFLKISFRESENKWSTPKALSKKINTYGLGNPFVTKNEEYLFFTRKDVSIEDGSETWNVHWVGIDDETL